MRILSKRIAKFDGKFVKRLQKVVKQLKYDNVMHPNHRDKAKNLGRVADRAEKLVKQLKKDVDKVNTQNRQYRKKIKQNLSDRKEMKHYLDELEAALRLFSGDDPLHADLKSIRKENEDCAQPPC